MKVLIIEDEERIARGLAKGLRQENYVVDIASDGEEGYDLAGGGEYDLVILDLMLPKMDGITVCRKLRADKIKTPILMLTAKDQVRDKVAGLDSGADDYLAKPFAFEELLSRMRALIRRPINMIENVLRFEDIEMDLTALTVNRGKKIIELSQKEFALLEYFLRNPKKVISKEQIISRIWSFEAEVLPNTIEVNIKNLRRKLGPPELIHTRRGFGYLLDTLHV